MKTVTGQLRPTAVEQKLIDAVAEDREADLRQGANGQLPEIRAELLGALCTDARSEWPVRDRIRIRGARVKGRLSLASASLAHELRFTDCVFEDRVEMQLARTGKPIEWNGGQVAAIMADEFESSADFIIQKVRVTGLISLHWASIHGDLRLTDSQLESPCDEVFYGKDLRVGGSLFLDGQDFHAEGEVCLRSAHIEGQLDCRHASFSNPLGHTINADHLVVEGEVLCEEGFRSNGEVCLQWARVQRLRATGGTFSSSTMYALHADALRAEAGIYLDRGFHATAAVRLVGATITGELCCTEGIFENPSARALDAERIVADDVYVDRGFEADGEVRFTDAQITRQFNASNGKFRNDQGSRFALDAYGLRCGGEMFLNEGFTATGQVRLMGAAIGSELNCTRGTFQNPDGWALFADGLTTPGTVYLDRGFSAHGQVRLARATVGRQLMCTGGTFKNEHDIALDITGLITPGDVLLNSGQEEQHHFSATGQILMRSTQITRDLDFSGAKLNGDEGLDARGLSVGGRLIWKMDPPPKGMVDLSSASISRLDDTIESWQPYRYTLDGLVFRANVDGPILVDQRIDWLDKTSEYSAGPYQQLAQSYRLGGRETDAEKILIACQRHQRTRGRMDVRSKIWNWFLGFTVGYGYRLHRTFLTLLVLGLIGWGLYQWGASADLIHMVQTVDGQHPSAANGCTAGIPCFNSAAYTIQMLVPGLDLHQATYWLPDAAAKRPWGGLLMAFTVVLIIAGWVAATAVVAGITRVFRRR